MIGLKGNLRQLIFKRSGSLPDRDVVVPVETGEGEALFKFAIPAGYDLWCDDTVHNLVTSDGLEAWAKNCIDSDGEVINRLAVSSNTAAPAASNSTLPGELATYTAIEKYAIGDSAIVIYNLLTGKRDDRKAETISKIGLYTTANGTTDSSDKLVAEALLDESILISGDLFVIFIWNLTVVTTGSSNQTVTDFGKHFIATRMIDLTRYGVLDHVAFGTGTAAVNGREASNNTLSALTSEVYRETPSTAWVKTASEAVISAAGALATSAAGGDLEEMGPAVGTTSAEGLLMQDRGAYTADNDSARITYTSTITFEDRSAMTAEHLKELLQDVMIYATNITYDSDNVASDATLSYPDGSAGLFARTSKDATWLAVNAYTATHSDSSLTATVTHTRNATTGAVEATTLSVA